MGDVITSYTTAGNGPTAHLLYTAAVCLSSLQAFGLASVIGAQALHSLNYRHMSMAHFGAINIIPTCAWSLELLTLAAAKYAQHSVVLEPTLLRHHQKRKHRSHAHGNCGAELSHQCPQSPFHCYLFKLLPLASLLSGHYAQHTCDRPMHAACRVFVLQTPDCTTTAGIAKPTSQITKARPRALKPAQAAPEPEAEDALPTSHRYFSKCEHVL